MVSYFEPTRNALQSLERGAATRYNVNRQNALDAANMQQRQRENALRDRQMQLNEQAGNRQNRLFEFKQMQAEKQAKEQERKQAIERINILGPAAKGIMAAPEPERQKYYDATRMQLEQYFPEYLGKLPETYEEALPAMNQLVQVYDSLNQEKASKGPMSVQEWEYYQALPEDQKSQYLTMKRADKFVDRGGSVVQVNPASPGEVSAEYGKTLKPGESPEERAAVKTAEKEAEAKVSKSTKMPKARDTLKSLNRQWNVVESKINKALGDIGPFTAGVGSWLSVIPASPAKDLSETLNTIKANIGFDKLQDMRDNSPTGGALGQVSEMENRLLQAVQGSMAQDQSPSQLRENLVEIKRLVGELRIQKNQAFETDFGGGNPQDQQQAPMEGARQAPDGNWYVEQNGQFFRVD